MTWRTISARTCQPDARLAQTHIAEMGSSVTPFISSPAPARRGCDPGTHMSHLFTPRAGLPTATGEVAPWAGRVMNDPWQLGLVPTHICPL